MKTLIILILSMLLSAAQAQQPEPVKPETPAEVRVRKDKQIIEILAQIAKEEAGKTVPLPRGVSRQKILDTQNEKIRLLKDAIWKIRASK